jgi:hypothetical protein
MNLKPHEPPAPNRHNIETTLDSATWVDLKKEISWSKGSHAFCPKQATPESSQTPHELLRMRSTS